MDLVDVLLGLISAGTLGLTTWSLKTTQSLQVRQSVNEALDKVRDQRLKENAEEIKSLRDELKASNVPRDNS